MAHYYNGGYSGYVPGIHYMRPPPTQFEYWNTYNTYWNNTCDIVQTRSYEHVSTQQSHHTGSYKNEYNTGSTYRVGNQSGYTEYHKHEQVNYGTTIGGYVGGNGYTQFGYYGPAFPYGNNYYYY